MGQVTRQQMMFDLYSAAAQNAAALFCLYQKENLDNG